MELCCYKAKRAKLADGGRKGRSWHRLLAGRLAWWDAVRLLLLVVVVQQQQQLLLLLLSGHH